MATSGGSHPDGDENIFCECASTVGENKASNAPSGGSKSELLTDILNLDEPVQNCEFLQMFTSQGVSTSYDSFASPLETQNSQLTVDGNDNADLSDTEYLDYIESQLQNFPKYIYRSKLLELFSQDEDRVLWYRNVKIIFTG
jgi:hypothetical protein